MKRENYMNDFKYLLSIIIPCCNAEKTISNCLDSILHQINDNVEVICINDGSDDKTIDILDKYSNRITIIDSEHEGVSVARNKGISTSKGQWIWFVDADDLITNDAISKIIPTLLDNNFDVISYAADVENNPNSDNKLSNLTTDDEVVSNDNVFNLWINKFHSPYVWNCIYKTDFLKKHHILFSKSLTIGEDMAFQMMVFSRAKQYRTYSFSIYIYKYLINDSVMKEALKFCRVPYHIDVLDEILTTNSHLLNEEQKKMLYLWSYDYVLVDCFLNPKYLPKLRKVWKKNKAKYPFNNGIKNKLKGLVLKNSLICKLFCVYKTIFTKRH